MNTFLLLQAIRNRLMPELENLPLLTRTRDRRDRQSPKTRPVAVSIGRRLRVGGCVLIFNAVLKLWKSAVKDVWGLLIFLAVLAASLLTSLSPVRYVLAAGNREGELAPWARPDEQAPSFAEAYVMTHWTMQGNE